MAVSEQYKQRVLEFMKAHPEGLPTLDLFDKFPRCPIREMEQEDGTIEYRDGRWHRQEIVDLLDAAQTLVAWCRDPIVAEVMADNADFQAAVDRLAAIAEIEELAKEE